MAGRLAHAAAAKLPDPLYRLVRSVRVKQEISGFEERMITRSYGHGVQLQISLQDPLAESWYAKEPPDSYPEMLAALSHGLEEGATVFDIGAHQAVVALVLADIVGPVGRVVAIEANRHNVNVARRNVELNRARNLSVVEAACTAQSGTVTFHDGLNGQIAKGRLGNRRVRAVTIDELAETYGLPDVVYLDIEGHELAALRGAERALAARCTFVIEVHAEHQLQAAGGSVDEIASMLEARGYRFQCLRDAAGEPDAAMRPAESKDLPRNERFFLLAYRDQSPRQAPSLRAPVGRPR